MRFAFMAFAAVLLALSLSGCLEGKEPSARRFAVNGVYANGNLSGEVFIDFNYTQDGVFSDLSMDFSERRFSIEIGGADCSFTPVTGVETNGGLVFTPKKTVGIDNKDHIIFNLGRIASGTSRVVVKGNVEGDCLGKISNGATVRLVLSATENPHDLNDLLSPYAEETLEELTVLGSRDFDGAWGRATKKSG